MRRPGKPTRRPRALLMSRLAIMAGLIASFAFPVFARDRTGPMPAEARTHGPIGGWVSVPGLLPSRAACPLGP
jgi:hypothetical protein